MSTPLLDCLDRHQLLDEANAIAEAWGSNLADAMGHSRKHSATRARHRVWTLLRDRTGLSYPEIGALTGHDHTTVLSAVAAWRDSQLVAVRRTAHVSGAGKSLRSGGE